MTALPPDQLQAIQAVLAQQAPAQAEQIAQSIAVTVQSSPVDVATLTRALVIEGTATQATALDQLLLRTGQGDFLLRTPENVRQLLQDNLPSRVSLQLRPGPNGLEAVLVIGTRAAQQAGQVEQSLATNSALSRQTLTSEIPKIGQVFQITVIPSALLSNLIYNQNKSSTQKQAPGIQSASVQTTSAGQQAIPLSAEDVVAGLKQPSQSQNVSTPPLQTNQPPVQTVNAGTASSRNNYDPNSTQGQPGNQSTPPQKSASSNLLSSNPQEALKLPLPVKEADLRPQLLPLRILNVADETAAVPFPDKATTAIVRGATPSGQPIITIDDQVAVVNTQKSWPVGTKLHVTLGAGAELVTEKEVRPTAISFEGLRQAIEFLAQQNPVLINEVKRFRLPQAQVGQLGGGILFFLAALQKNSLNAWLGNDVNEALETNDKRNILTALKQEFETSSQPALDNQGSSWRGTVIPYLEGDKLGQFRFYVHDDPRQKQHTANPRDMARRFLIDVSLSRLGPVQIDGLVHQKKLDLIVRTGNHLPDELRNDLRVRFGQAMEAIRYTGSLIFQANRTNWVELKTRSAQSLSRNL